MARDPKRHGKRPEKAQEALPHGPRSKSIDPYPHDGRDPQREAHDLWDTIKAEVDEWHKEAGPEHRPMSKEPWSASNYAKDYPMGTLPKALPRKVPKPLRPDQSALYVIVPDERIPCKKCGHVAQCLTGTDLSCLRQWEDIPSSFSPTWALRRANRAEAVNGVLWDRGNLRQVESKPSLCPHESEIGPEVRDPEEIPLFMGDPTPLAHRSRRSLFPGSSRFRP